MYENRVDMGDASVATPLPTIIVGKMDDARIVITGLPDIATGVYVAFGASGGATVYAAVRECGSFVVTVPQEQFPRIARQLYTVRWKDAGGIVRSGYTGVVEIVPSFGGVTQTGGVGGHGISSVFDANGHEHRVTAVYDDEMESWTLRIGGAE